MVLLTNAVVETEVVASVRAVGAIAPVARFALARERRNIIVI